MEHAERGATAVEYALLLAFIAVVIIGTVVIFGGEVLALVASVPAFLPAGTQADRGPSIARSGYRKMARNFQDIPGL